jgi:hypothetical protein
MNNGQRITSPEGSGEVLTTFGDKVVLKLDNGDTTTLAADQVQTECVTDLSNESPILAKARAEHAAQIVNKLDHSNEKQNQIPMEISEKAIDVINDLIKINNDRVAGFEKAGTDLEGDDNGLIAVFNKLAGESQQYVVELTDIAEQYGGEPVYFGETDHPIPWQTDHLNCWRKDAANAVEAFTKIVI